MPSREEQWSSIPTDSRVTSKLSHLTPRKAVNNLTRITHRYNYDYVEVSGEESMEEFIKATDSSESSSDRSTSTKPDRKKQKGHRVHGYRPRIAHQSDDSSDDDHPPSPRHQTEDTAPHASRLPTPTTGLQDSGLQPRKAGNVKNRKKSTNGGLRSKTQCAGKEKPVMSVEEIQPASMKKSRRKLLLESDNEESSQSSSSDDPVQPKSDKKSRKSGVLNSDSDEDTEPYYTLPKDESTRDKDGSSTTATKESSKQPRKNHQNSESKEKEFSDKKGPMDEQTSVLFHQGDNNSLQEAPIQKACSGKTPSKDCEDGKSADDGVITVYGSGSSSCDDSGSSSCDDSGSSSCDNDSDSSGTDGGSTDEGESVGRIQKLAARRKKERDSRFGKLKSARAKKQKNT
ncbi:hypothetical protein ACOMHN_048719 [Nucella lapillus]